MYLSKNIKIKNFKQRKVVLNGEVKLLLKIANRVRQILIKFTQKNLQRNDGENTHTNVCKYKSISQYIYNLNYHTIKI
jgi:hypothetical protein